MGYEGLIMTKVIKTDRLQLRPLELSDAAQITALIGDLEVARWLTVVPHPYSIDDAVTYIREHSPEWRFGIEVDGVIAGNISMTNELGYWLGKPYWGRGYMTEAASAVVNHWFRDGGGDLKSGYFIENVKSRAILEGLGFQNSHILQDTSLATGETKALQKMELTAVDWHVRHD